MSAEVGILIRRHVRLKSGGELEGMRGFLGLATGEDNGVMSLGDVGGIRYEYCVRSLMLLFLLLICG